MTTRKILNQYAGILRELKKPINEISEDRLDDLLQYFSNEMNKRTSLDEKTKLELSENANELEALKLKERRRNINKETVKKFKKIKDPDYKDLMNVALAKKQLEMKEVKEIDNEFEMSNKSLVSPLLNAIAQKGIINTTEITNIEHRMYIEKDITKILKEEIDKKYFPVIKELVDTINSRYKDYEERARKLY